MSPRRALALAAGTLVALAAVLGAPGAAGAHVLLRGSEPSAGAEIFVAPRAVVLRFSEAPLRRFSGVSLIAGRRRYAARLEVRGRVIRATLPAGLGRGSYTVHWHVLSADGHPTRGVFAFGVGRAAGMPEPEPGAGPTARSDVLRWLYFLMLALVGGGLVFRRTVLAPAARSLPASGPRLEPRWEWTRSGLMAALAAFVALQLDLYAYVDWAHQIVGGPWHSFSEAQLQDLRSGTPTGIAWTLTSFGWLGVLALIGLATVRPRRRERLADAAGAGGLLCGLGLSLTSHAAAQDGRLSLSMAADYVHLTAAAVWLGGLVWLLAVAWPASRHLAGADGRRFLADVIVRFSSVAGYAVAALALAGGFLALSRLHSLTDLRQTYGVVLLIKTEVAAAALLFGAYHRFWVVPRLRGDDGAARRRFSLATEAGLVVAVMLLAAVLSNTSPPG